MKKINLLIMGIMCILFTKNVYAKDIYYSNDSNVSFTLEEYNFISNFYYDGFQDYINDELYNIIFEDNNILNENIVKNYYSIDSNNRSSYYQTNSKRLSVSKVCGTTCLISTSVEWLKSPVVRSYDVIGAYFDGISLYSTPQTIVMNSVDSRTISTYKADSSGHGFGVSAKLISTGSDMYLTQTYRVSGSGTLYASYQHATSSISLANSKRYTISLLGYGSVFLFDTPIQGYYDGMNGVSISI